MTSLNRHTDGLDYAERALAMVERLGDGRLKTIAYLVLGNIKARCNDIDAGRASLERALAQTWELDDPALAAEACAYLANACAFAGDLDRSRELSILRVDLARRSHDLFQLRHAYAWIGLVETLQGRWNEEEQWFLQQAQLLLGLESPEPRASLRGYRGLLRYFQGRFEEAERDFCEAIELLRPTGSGARVYFLGRLGLILAELCRRDEALACLTELHALATSLDERAPTASRSRTSRSATPDSARATAPPAVLGICSHSRDSAC